MTTSLQEAMTAGVLVEFFDAQGQLIGQAVFTNWQGRPVPGAGDTLCCTVRTAMKAQRKVRGRVRSRHFDLQHDANGKPCVWVRLEVDEVRQLRPSHRSGPVWFSPN